MSRRVETDPIGAIRHELVEAARRRNVRRRRRTRAIVAAAIALVALGGTSGALALTNTGTGVPAIDRILDVVSRPRAYAPGVTPPGAPAPPEPNIRPLPGTLGGEVSLRLPAGRGVAIGYMTGQGLVCSALADVDAPPGAPQFGGITCSSTRLLARSLKSEPVRLVGGGGPDDETSIVQGFARGDVESLTLIGPGQAVDAVLSPAWTPRGWSGPPLRFFVAQVDAPDGPGRMPALVLRARLADGRTVELGR